MDSGGRMLPRGPSTAMGSGAHDRTQENLDSQALGFPTHDFRILPRKDHGATEPEPVGIHAFADTAQRLAHYSSEVQTRCETSHGPEEKLPHDRTAVGSVRRAAA